jgi:hypothetical protein
MKRKVEQTICSFRFQKSLLEHLRIASIVEEKSMSMIVRVALGRYLDNFYKHKKNEILQKKQGFKEIENQAFDNDWNNGSFILRS